MRNFFYGIVVVLVLRASALAVETPEDFQQASKKITAPGLLEHVKVLASDEFEGRAPGTKGEEKTVAYLVKQFKKLGLKPGNPDGTYIQKVPMFKADFKYQASFTKEGTQTSWVPSQDIVAISHHQVPKVSLKNSEMVFVGYGVVAPEYDWDDFKGVDVRGKTIVMLVGDPAIPDPQDPLKLDDKVFQGKAMTYYGRWTYKYEIAAKMGAAAALIVHETKPAGYPFEVLIESGREVFDFPAKDQNRSKVPVEAWLNLETAKKLFVSAGQDFDALKKAAIQRDFKPVSLGTRFQIDINRKSQRMQSWNVIAKLEGSDPQERKSAVIYTAHWDHFGMDPKLKGDQIFNGALDNATGVSAVLKIAEAFKKLKTPPKASLLFLIPTGEERNLLGSEYYVNHPLFPIAQTRANINIDGFNPWGLTSDVELTGYGKSTIDDTVRAVAALAGRDVFPESFPERGLFYRSDHFNFAKTGVPALFLRTGTHFIGKPEGFGKQKVDDFVAHDYHKPTDEIKADWDLAGGVQNAQLLFQVGYRLAQDSKWPEWAKDAEFRSKRESPLGSASGKAR